ncbi:hypothetical protein C9374_006292 [Naegleria lovaniensis]|uniref:Phosphatidylinositol-3,4,5-trisphosphate 3-phosphatase n=1 Tax=Naegleria lovaniensis TaxID=51637 RepID=A0AA88KJ07_NAELO|nr:uncharacterized protein C9374_006292 [Naegleria lovaniensis]KAG2381303.1 hypothetical protein C9374_006292 [Naegleria lovaniensis]
MTTQTHVIHMTNSSLEQSSSFNSPLQHILESVRAEFRKKRAGGRKLFKGLNYNLDITYITSRIIVMSIPTEDWFIGYFRNDANLVHQFLEDMHGRDHYMIFNLSEFRYDKKVFYGNVIDWNFPDHYNPPLDMMMSGCRCIHEWLERDEKNVAVIHCAGGKGRSGTLICAYLLYCSMFNDSIDSLNYFALQRFEKPVSHFRLVKMEELIRRHKFDTFLIFNT